mmetsp:Transcript_14018/g.42172  ORF Transcript_14018/g.42172 Transcript_14018/m.42172 type:complete len:81 (+) Transcript_14018:61-303(+)
MAEMQTDLLLPAPLTLASVQLTPVAGRWGMPSTCHAGTRCVSLQVNHGEVQVARQGLETKESRQGFGETALPLDLQHPLY